MVRLMLKKCATEAIKLTIVSNMSTPAVICLLLWAITLSYYYGMRQGIEIGVQRSALVINCPNTFGEK
jgi:hypothetical protein